MSSPIRRWQHRGCHHRRYVCRRKAAACRLTPGSPAVTSRRVRGHWETASSTCPSARSCRTSAGTGGGTPPSRAEWSRRQGRGAVAEQPHRAHIGVFDAGWIPAASSAWWAPAPCWWCARAASAAAPVGVPRSDDNRCRGVVEVAHHVHDRDAGCGHGVQPAARRIDAFAHRDIEDRAQEAARADRPRPSAVRSIR